MQVSGLGYKFVITRRLPVGSEKGSLGSVTYVETVIAALMDIGQVDLAERVWAADDEDDVPPLFGPETDAEWDLLAKACDIAYQARGDG